MFLKPVEPGTGQFTKTIINLGQVTLNDSDLKFTYANRTLLNNEFGNMFSSFNLPITTLQKNKFLSTRQNGGYIDTGFSGFNQDEIIFIEIPKNFYGELIDGKKIKLKIPTGSTPSDVIYLYSTFVEQTNYKQFFDTLYSDSSNESQEFGQPIGSLTPYESNVAFLFSDSIKKPKGDVTKSWSTGYNTGNGFLTNNKEPFKFFSSNPSEIDEPLGIVYLDKGFIVLTHPTIVSNFPFSAGTIDGTNLYTGNTEFSDLYFTGSTLSELTFNSINTEFIQHITCFAQPNEFFETTNPTFLESYGSGGIGVESVYVTEIGLYNDDDELVAIVKPDRPIEKGKNQALLFDIQIKV
jgi:hypothetical protein